MSTLKKITSWSALLTQWQKVATEPEAIGLLYAMARLRGDSDGLAGNALFARKTEFFLEQAASASSELADLAQQLTVKELLYDALELSWHGEIGPSYQSLVVFLGQRRAALLEPPYPRFISHFLEHSTDKWAAVQSGSKRAAYAMLTPEHYGNTEQLAKALMAWGLVHVLILHRPVANHSISPQAVARLVLPYLQDHVNGENKDSDQIVRRAIAVSLSKYRDPTDLTDIDTIRAVNFSNALTMHYFKLWL